MCGVSVRVGSYTMSGYKKTKLKIALCISHAFCNDPMKGARMHLDTMVMRYWANVGVIICFLDVKMANRSAKVVVDVKSPYFTFNVHVTALVFAPTVGDVLEGRVNNIGTDHIGILVYGVFNASVRGDDTSRFKCNIEQTCWISTTDSKTTIEIGSTVAFRVKELNIYSDIFSIVGEMNDKKTKLIAPPPVKNTVKEEEEEEEDEAEEGESEDAEMSDVPQAQTKKRKNAEDEKTNNHTASKQEAGSDSEESDVEPKKKKKKQDVKAKEVVKKTVRSQPATPAVAKNEKDKKKKDKKKVEVSEDEASEEEVLETPKAKKAKATAKPVVDELKASSAKKKESANSKSTPTPASTTTPKSTSKSTTKDTPKAAGTPKQSTNGKASTRTL